MAADSEEVHGIQPTLSRASRSSSAVSRFELSRPGRLLSNASARFTESRPPVGMFHAFGSVASNVPTLNDIESGNFDAQGWSATAQRRNSQARRISLSEAARPALPRQPTLGTILEPEKTDDSEVKPAVDHETKVGEQVDNLPIVAESPTLTPHDPSIPYANGYQFPPKRTFWQSVTISLRAFSKWVITPFGFLLTIYALNIVAWGGMLFLILIHATPAMSHPSWTSWQSGAKTWLEIDSQILNALFCVTGLGLAPWRFRDLYFLLRWRYKKDESALRKLAGIHRDWFRLEGSEKLDPLFNPETDPIPPEVNENVLALPVALSPSAPLTGERATPSKYWKLSFVIWAFVWNTLLQCVLCGLMWGLNKYKRPSWSVGLFISLACIIAASGGWVVFKEGKRVKNVEGVPITDEDRRLIEKISGKEKERMESFQMV